MEQKSTSAVATHIVEDAFQLLNEMVCSADSNVLNVIEVTVFEIFSDTKVCADTAQKLLRGEALKLFEEVYRVWGE